MSRQRSFQLIAAAAAAVVLVAATSTIVKIGKSTHLGVPVGSIVNLTTAVLPNDNSGGHMFHYDNGVVFTVPKGYCLVVTDVFVSPETISSAPNDFNLVVVNLSPIASRTLDARFAGTEMRHYALRSGMVVPGLTTPTARNTTFSDHTVSVQLLGYLVKGKALPENTSAFEI